MAQRGNLNGIGKYFNQMVMKTLHNKIRGMQLTSLVEENVLPQNK